eukprot:scaffold181556_cov19-Tisochrysis_lutea.AAC.1
MHFKVALSWPTVQKRATREQAPRGGPFSSYSPEKGPASIAGKAGQLSQANVWALYASLARQYSLSTYLAAPEWISTHQQDDAHQSWVSADLSKFRLIASCCSTVVCCLWKLIAKDYLLASMSVCFKISQALFQADISVHAYSCIIMSWKKPVQSLAVQFK